MNRRERRRLLDRDDAWLVDRIGERAVEVLDLDHPAVAAPIVVDIDAGTKVYYDRRWRVSERFAAFLEARPELLRGRVVAVLGCGVGLEALAAAPHASRLILNDLSDAAVELSGLQLERNGFAAYDRVVGRYEEASLPAAEIAIGSFLVYDAETLAAMTAFMERTGMPVVLANDPMEAFDDLLHASGRRIERLTDFEDLPIVRFDAGNARP